MTEVMLALGDFRFSQGTAAYQSLSREVSWRWEAVDRIGAAPAGQYLGPGEDTLTLEGTLYPHHKGGLGQIEAMKAVAGTGAPLLLVDGLGNVWGAFAILAIAEKQSVFIGPGAALKVEFSLRLRAVAEEA